MWLVWWPIQRNQTLILAFVLYSMGRINQKAVSVCEGRGDGGARGRALGGESAGGGPLVGGLGGGGEGGVAE